MSRTRIACAFAAVVVASTAVASCSYPGDAEDRAQGGQTTAAPSDGGGQPSDGGRDVAQPSDGGGAAPSDGGGEGAASDGGGESTAPSDGGGEDAGASEGAPAEQLPGNHYSVIREKLIGPPVLETWTVDDSKDETEVTYRELTCFGKEKNVQTGTYSGKIVDRPDAEFPDQIVWDVASPFEGSPSLETDASISKRALVTGVNPQDGVPLNADASTTDFKASCAEAGVDLGSLVL